ncbi:hypothetical protein [Pantanalinema sp. GBBB05]|uniref:hypothetical protein n=1 Tax=Pantanalinema sp. GBBB05 TaxID=2604139 RepID=UPI001D36CCF4|nr:hypothetical protein [Pantanalinema sp. GBBB05]
MPDTTAHAALVEYFADDAAPLKAYYGRSAFQLTDDSLIITCPKRHVNGILLMGGRRLAQFAKESELCWIVLRSKSRVFTRMKPSQLLDYIEEKRQESRQRWLEHNSSVEK